MSLRNSILLLSIPIFLSACFDSTQKKKYSVTTYFTSFDSSSNSMGKEGQKFKYSYEEYNSDSNLIYQELYATTNNFGDMWGKLLEKTKFFYKGKDKIKAEIEFGTPYNKSDEWREKGKYIDTYEYSSNELSKWISDGKVKEEYAYNNKKELEKQIIYSANILGYYHFTYSNGLKIKKQYFAADTIFLIDTFIYDKNNKLVDTYSYDSEGKTVGHRRIVRNDKGQAIEEKWKEPYIGWRARKDGQLIEDEFYQINKYYYDSKGRSVKTEFYDIGNLKTVYEFKYE
jgi:hypothetical protein